MLGASGVVDTVAQAKIIEPIGPRRMLAPREQQGVDHPFAADHRLGGALELGIEEAEIERGVVRHQRRFADEGEELVGDFGEQRLVLQELGGEAVNLERGSRHLALRIDVAVEALAGGNLVVELDAADLDEPVALVGIEPRRLGVQHDFPHGATLPGKAARSDDPARQARDGAQDATNLGTGGIESPGAIHHEMRPPAFFHIGDLLRKNGLELRCGHARTAQHTRALGFRPRRHHYDGIDAFLCAGLEQKRDIEHDHGLSARGVLGQELGLRFAHQRMNDRLEPANRGRILERTLGELRPVDLAACRGARERRLDSDGRFALVEPMHRAIGIVDRYAGLGKEPCRRRFAHSDRAGEAEHEHHAPVFAAVVARMSASSRARNSGVTRGVEPNHRTKPRTAWCISRPSPSATRWPRSSAARSSAVFSGT